MLGCIVQWRSAAPSCIVTGVGGSLWSACRVLILVVSSWLYSCHLAHMVFCFLACQHCILWVMVSHFSSHCEMQWDLTYYQE